MTNNQATNWKQTIALNQRKTFLVILTFMAIYLLIGFLFDLYLNGAFIQGQFFLVFQSLITFRKIPVLTLATGIIAIVSLIIAYSFYDKLMLLGTNYHEINAKTQKNDKEHQLYNVVEEMKIAAGLHYMPKVYVIDANYMNAFASGYSEKSAMIAVTKGLLDKLNREELQAVIAHELSHIRHGDIRLTLTASILANLMLIVVDIFFYRALFSRDNRGGNNQFLIIIILLRYLLPVITMLLILYLSRTREYMADAGSVELMRDNTPLGRALLKISQDYDQDATNHQDAYRKTPHEDVRRSAYIFDPFADGIHPVKTLTTLFSTHPSIKDRLRAIGFNGSEV